MRIKSHLTKYFLIPVILTLCWTSCGNRGRINLDLSENNPVKVGIQPYLGINPDLCKVVKNAIEEYYGFRAYILNPVPLPKEAFINVKSPRYRADKLIKIMKDNKPDSLDYILGLTHKDISTTKKDKNGNVLKPEWKYEDWGILGLGFRPGPTCMVSTFRLYHDDQTIFINRLIKVSLHELGHNLGLPHCETPRCLMNDANEKISTVDNAEAILCQKCKSKIEHLTHF